MSGTRRSFLQTTGTGTSVLAAASLVNPVFAGRSQPDTIRLGIIGCGGMMNGHVSGLVDAKEKVSFAWLCDIDPAQLERIALYASSAPECIASNVM